VRGDNPSRYGKPTVPATVMLLNAETGELSAVMGGTYLTASRTAAGSAVATELCLRLRQSLSSKQQQSGEQQQQQSAPSSSQLTISHLVVFGAGLQGHEHIKAMQCIAHVQKVTIINRTKERAEQLKQELLSSPPLPSKYQSPCSPAPIEGFDVVILDDKDNVKRAVSTATVIVTATNAVTPLFPGEWVSPGCHLVSVGSYTPNMQELDNTIVNRCLILYDTPEALQVGDLKHLSSEDDISSNSNLVGLVGDVLANEALLFDDSSPSGSTSSSDLDCTMFKSVGTAIQDVFTANTVVQTARELGIGQEVSL
jgi:ornithine cyclodeaminase